MTNKKGLLIIISGPSGCGKGTILNKLLKNNTDTYLSISATTRKPRKGEIDGVNYYFISKEEFENDIKNQQMLEYTNYCGNYYGTPVKHIFDKINSGKNVILEIEIEGALQTKNKYKDSILIFIMPPSMNELERRLMYRNTEDKNTIKIRMSKAKEEIKMALNYDYIIINDEVDNAVKAINSIMYSEKYKAYQNKNIINEVLEDAQTIK